MPYSPSVLPRDFLAAHLAAHPEDASTLGIAGFDESLPDPTLPPLAPAIEGADDDLDVDAARRVAAFHARYRSLDLDASNLELAALPNAMAQHAALHARSDDAFRALASRLLAIPSFLDAHASALLRGAPDADVTTVFVERVLPSAADAIATIPFAAAAKRCAPDLVARLSDRARAASDAYRALTRTVATEVAPRARIDVVLGEAETAFRLADVMGVETSADELVREARDDLARLRDRVQRDALMTLLAPRPSSLDDALAGYRRHLADATNLVRDRELVPLPSPLALELEPLPGGIAEGASVTNWPAPLFEPNGKGHVLYATDPAAHAIVSMKNLAVHEGIPGHYLQSAFWQRHATPAHACRYLGVADHVAFARGYFGTTLAVEGWAVYMEHLLRRHGFYDTKEELLFFDFCEAIRAMRVVLDLELQRGRMSGEEAARFVADATAMPETWARAQVVRAKRLPLQGITYQVGAREIGKLRKTFRGDDIVFHEQLLLLGPIPPSRAARALASASASASA